MNEDRINHPNMEYYRETYKNSERWDGEQSLENKVILLYMEQGIGDILQFVRFIRFLKNCKVIVHAPTSLHRIIKTLGLEVIDKENPELPNHDFHILSLDLPLLLKCPIPLEPYIHIKEKTELLPGYNIGIAWEGSIDHVNNEKRSCHLKYFKPLQRDGVNLFCLTPEIKNYELVSGCEDMVLHGVELNDFYDTAKLINSLDLIASVDTAVLHLTGAMGKTGYGLLNPEVRDNRWDYIWYPSLMLLKGGWAKMIEKIELTNYLKGK